MVVGLMRHTSTLTTASIERMLGSSPQCRTALLRFATTVSGARIRPTLSGHGSSAAFTTSQFGNRASGGAAFSGPRAATRQRSPVARSSPGSTERSIDGRVSNATVAARSIALADRCRHSARIRAHQHRRVDRHIDAPERATHQSRIACEWGTPWMCPNVRKSFRNQSRSGVAANCSATRPTH